MCFAPYNDRKLTMYATGGQMSQRERERERERERGGEREKERDTHTHTHSSERPIFQVAKGPQWYFCCLAWSFHYRVVLSLPSGPFATEWSFRHRVVLSPLSGPFATEWSFRYLTQNQF